MRLRTLTASLMMLVGMSAAAHAEIDQTRVALVIGNQDYRYAGELSQTRHDASEFGATLARLGFEVTLLHDADRREMEQALNDFRRDLRDADVALVYYSGHGLEVDGVNYLAPVSARLGDHRSLEQEFIALDEVMDIVEGGGAAFNMVFLDACRNNPFVDQLPASRSADAAPGLAPISAPVGTVVGYATAPGTLAWEGGGAGLDNSMYTEALMNWMETPGMEIAQLLRHARADVMEWTGGEQVPWEHSAMIGEFFFAPEGVVFDPANDDLIASNEGDSQQSSLFGTGGTSSQGQAGNDQNQPQPQPQDQAGNDQNQPVGGVVGTITPNAVISLLSQMGMSANLDRDEEGPILVVNTGGNIPGAETGVWFYDCDGSDNCGSFQIWTFFDTNRPVDLRVINRWNAENRWAIASIEEGQYPVLLLDINVAGGVSNENIADLLYTFTEQVSQFQTYIM